MAKLPIRFKRNTDEPLEAQVVRQISEFIKSGKLKPGAALPSTHSFGEQLGISRETVRRAYVQLREAKLIEREGKLGGWVTIIFTCLVAVWSINVVAFLHHLRSCHLDGSPGSSGSS